MNDNQVQRRMKKLQGCIYTVACYLRNSAKPDTSYFV